MAGSKMDGKITGFPKFPFFKLGEELKRNHIAFAGK